MVVPPIIRGGKRRGSFVAKHQDKITGILSCFDRIIIKGYLPFSYPLGMEGFLGQQNILIKEFPKLAKQQSEPSRRTHGNWPSKRASARDSPAVQNSQGRPCPETSPAGRDRRGPGLCLHDPGMLLFVQDCLRGGRPNLVAQSKPRCLVLYFYYLDPEFGLLHIRLPTWFPSRSRSTSTVTNGWPGNSPSTTSASPPATTLFWPSTTWPKPKNWPTNCAAYKWRRFLDGLGQTRQSLAQRPAQEVRSITGSPTRPSSPPTSCSRTASICNPCIAACSNTPRWPFPPRTSLSFLGKKLHGNLAAEVTTDCKNRPQGFRVKHRYGGNWLKMYDKFGQVLRIEMVINQPRCFKVCRWGNRKGQRVPRLVPLDEERRLPRPLCRGLTSGHASLPRCVGCGRGPAGSVRKVVGPRLQPGPVSRSSSSRT